MTFVFGVYIADPEQAETRYFSEFPRSNGLEIVSEDFLEEPKLRVFVYSCKSFVEHELFLVEQESRAS